MALQSAVTPDTVQNIEVASSNQNQKANRGMQRDLQRDALSQDSQEKQLYREHQMQLQAQEQAFAEQQRRQEQQFMVDMQNTQFRRQLTMKKIEARALQESVGIAAQTDAEIEQADLERATAELSAREAAMVAQQLTPLTMEQRQQAASDIAAAVAARQSVLDQLGTTALDYFGIVNAETVPQAALEASTPTPLPPTAAITPAGALMGNHAVGRMLGRAALRATRGVGEMLGYTPEQVTGGVMDTGRVVAQRIETVYSRVPEDMVAALVQGDEGVGAGAAAAATKDVFKVAQELALMTARNMGGSVPADPAAVEAMSEKLKAAVQVAEMNGVEPAELLVVAKAIELGFSSAQKTGRENQVAGNKQAPEIRQMEQETARLASAITSSLRIVVPDPAEEGKRTLEALTKGLSLLGDHGSDQMLNEQMTAIMGRKDSLGRAFRSSNAPGSIDRVKSMTAQRTQKQQEAKEFEQQAVGAQQRKQQARTRGAVRQAESGARAVNQLSEELGDI